MKTPDKFRCAMGMVAIFASLCAQAYPGESIVLDPVTGNYTITYWDDLYYGDKADGPPAGLQQTIFVPATKIIPTLHSQFRWGEAGSVVYRYTMYNGAAAKEPIIRLTLEQAGQVTGERNLPAKTASMAELE